MPFDKQPTLTGKLVAVRPLVRSDYDSLHAVASDPLIWEQHPVPNRHEEPAFRDFFDESLESGGALLVTDLETGDVIGSTRFHGYSELKSEVEIGWTFLARSYWGGRYNRDLKAVMVRHAFQFVESIVLLIDPTNLRSQRAATKIGAVAERGLDKDGRMIFRLSKAV
jgi:RimJ/RimL family protein N-acetyltransferase